MSGSIWLSCLGGLQHLVPAQGTGENEKPGDKEVVAPCIHSLPLHSDESGTELPRPSTGNTRCAARSCPVLVSHGAIGSPTPGYSGSG